MLEHWLPDTACRSSAALAPTRAARRGHRHIVAHHRVSGGSAEEHCAESLLDVAAMRMQACVALIRWRPRGRPFTPRDGATLDLIHSELAWVYAPELPLLSPDGMPLSPRQRQTLQLLLAGNSEKEIAGQMGLSHNTVHHYVKAIHRHFGVSSRSELLARRVRK